MKRPRSYVYTYGSVKRKGKKDGRDWRWKFWPPKWPFRESKEPIPPISQSEPAQFESALTEAAEADMQSLAEEWKAMDEKLKPEYCQAEAERGIAKETYEKEAGEEKTALGVYEKASEAFLKVPSPPLSPSWMRFWLFVIAIGEFPLNAVVFQVLGQSRAETYLVAAFIGIFFPLAAHAFGKSLRQENKSKTDQVLVALSPLFVLAILTGLGFVRAKFFEALELQQLLGITVTPTQATVLFIVINIAVFFVAVVISYQGSHGNEAEYNTLQKAFMHALNRLGKESGEAKAAAERLTRAEERFQKALHRRHKSFEKIAEQAKHIKETNDWFVSVYRFANMEARRNPANPECFKKPPAEAKIPDSLQNLDWDCPKTPGTGTVPKAEEEKPVEDTP